MFTIFVFFRFRHTYYRYVVGSCLCCVYSAFRRGGSHFQLSHIRLAESICFVLTLSTLGHRAYSE
ncbi:hypothetical protein C0J52_27191 [Blattella germanica]|nr:hypothetical protein C0J52_27191 [Blattella germanica]